ncbi:glycosyltransferase [Sulfurovum sp. AR]|uniref:glycosyltransferase family protein n=1 Tax=Sulfurovum sp. AR TaxID=1165841 RepID=UPI00025C4BB2|nr:glycosyltransferase [Sulfurovum sp. AR]EIF50997.1 hypothetical protein SULAR_06498 [Sulfurovum sp. AR]
MKLIKKVKYHFENMIYKKRFGKKFYLDDYKIKGNNFSGRKLNIITLFHTINTFAENNIIAPLKELGDVDIFELTPVAHSKEWYKYKSQKNRLMLNFVDNITSKKKVDVIMIYITGHGTDMETLKKLREYNIPIISECYDDERKFRSRKGKDGIYRGMKDVCKYFDLSLTTSKSAIIKYLVEGGHPIYKDFAGNEKIYKNLYLEKEYDVGFVGASYGVRGEYINFLRQNGISVYTKGNGWKEGFAEADEMIEIFNKSKIVLGFSTVGKNDDIYILKGRDFEVPFTGSFYITGYHEELKEYFELEKDIETYTSKEDLLKKVIYYLSHEQEREAIAQNGYQKCLQNYTAKKSYEKVFGYLDL